MLTAYDRPQISCFILIKSCKRPACPCMMCIRRDKFWRQVLDLIYHMCSSLQQAHSHLLSRPAIAFDASPLCQAENLPELGNVACDDVSPNATCIQLPQSCHAVLPILNRSSVQSHSICSSAITTPLVQNTYHQHLTVPATSRTVHAFALQSVNTGTSCQDCNKLPSAHCRSYCTSSCCRKLHLAGVLRSVSCHAFTQPVPCSMRAKSPSASAAFSSLRALSCSEGAMLVTADIDGTLASSCSPHHVLLL